MRTEHSMLRKIPIWNWFRHRYCILFDQLPRNVYKSKFPM